LLYKNHAEHCKNKRLQATREYVEKRVQDIGNQKPHRKREHSVNEPDDNIAAEHVAEKPERERERFRYFADDINRKKNRIGPDIAL
jgi:hypothetical protein